MGIDTGTLEYWQYGTVPVIVNTDNYDLGSLEYWQYGTVPVIYQQTSGGPITATPDDAYHEHYAESPTVTVTVIVTPTETYHEHYADNITATTSGTVTVDEAYQEHYADVVTAQRFTGATADEAYHEHYADSVTASVGGAVDPQETYHEHYADSVSASAHLYATVDDATQLQYADNVYATLPGEGPSWVFNPFTGTLDKVGGGAGSGVALPVKDDTAIVKGSEDPTKRIRFEVDGISPNTTRVITVPDQDITLVDENHTHDWMDVSKAGSKVSDIEDVPAYAGNAGKALTVKPDESGTEWTEIAPATHNHDDRYYTETELNTAGAGGQVHWDNVTSKPSTYPPSAHTHTSADISDFVEASQDAVGQAMVDSSTIDFIYDDAGNTIKAEIIDESIFDKHINPKAEIQWSKISKAGSSLAHLEVRNLSDLTIDADKDWQGKAITNAGDITATRLKLTNQLPTTMVRLGTATTVTSTSYVTLLSRSLIVPPSGNFMVIFNGTINVTYDYTDVFFQVRLSTGLTEDPASGLWNCTEANLSYPVSGVVLMSASPGANITVYLDWRVGQSGKEARCRPGVGAEHFRLWVYPLP